MDERYIFNAAQNEYAGTIHKMADLALQEGYKFILFNDQVYCISEDIIINTGFRNFAFNNRILRFAGCTLGKTEASVF